MFITNNLLIDLFITLSTIVAAAALYIKHCYSYWTRRGIPQLSPTFPFGDYFKNLPKGISLGPYSVHYYNAFKSSGYKIGGVYLGLDPYLVVVDPVYAKDVLTKDFQYFVDRGIYLNEKNPITVNILTQAGDEWRKARTKFSCMFTSLKMKYFFSTMKSCTRELEANLESQAQENKDIDIYEIMACYFTDIIGLSHIQPEIESFFFNFVPEALEYRKKNNIRRTDFLQLLIDLKESGVDLTIEEMVSQAFLFFSAGFETSSAISSFLFYELGLHPDIQERVRKEINTVLEKYDGDITYDALKEMKYLQQLFDETIRKYPVLTTLNRVCVKDYKFQNSDVIIEKGTGIILPVLGYHRDPEVFPDPMKWDPDRFEDKNFNYDGYFPFGDGPRNCIGGRFGLLQVKLGLVIVISNYQISVSPKTKGPLHFDEHTFVTRTKETILLGIKKISS